MAKRSEETITCLEIMMERDRLMVAAFNILNQLASKGAQMVKEGEHGLTLQHIFLSWHSQGDQKPISSPDCLNELRVKIETVKSNFFESRSTSELDQ
jgi:hypothetical protein